MCYAKWPGPRRSPRARLLNHGRVIGHIITTPRGLAVILGNADPNDSPAIEVADGQSFAITINWRGSAKR